MRIAKIENQQNALYSHYVGELIQNTNIQNGLTGTELTNKAYLSQQRILRHKRE